MKNGKGLLHKRIEMPREISSVVFGLVILLGIKIITSFVNFQLYKSSLSYVYDFSGNYEVKLAPIIQIFYWITYAFNFFAPLLAGLLVGWMLKKKHKKYTLILGIIAGVVPMLMTLTYLFWPDRFFIKDVSRVVTESFVYTNLLKQILNTIRVTFLSFVGGYIGNNIGKNSTKYDGIIR